jgi:hypothetical protein
VSIRAPRSRRWRPGVLHHPARRDRRQPQRPVRPANADTVVVAFRTRWPPSRRARPSTPAAAARCTCGADRAGRADFIGIPGATGTLAPEKKPQVAGIFTDLKVPPQPGLSARVDIDTRFITAPTTLKPPRRWLVCWRR